MIRKLFHTLDRGFALVEDWSLFFAVMAALGVAMANIVLRKLTTVNLYWSDEVVRKVIYFTTYIGAVAAIRHRSLIRIDVLPQMFPLLKKPLALVGNLAMVLFASLMVWLGGKMTLSAYRDEYARTATLQIPEWWFYAVLPLMGAMMFIRALLVMMDEFAGPGSPKPKDVSDE